MITKVGCCVLWPVFRRCGHSKAGQNIYVLLFPDIFPLFQPFIIFFYLKRRKKVWKSVFLETPLNCSTPKRWVTLWGVPNFRVIKNKKLENQTSLNQVLSKFKESIKLRRFFASLFFFSDKNRWKMVEEEDVWKQPKKYFNQLSGASSTHKLVQIRNSWSTSFYVYGVRLKFCLQILIVLLLLNF